MAVFHRGWRCQKFQIQVIVQPWTCIIGLVILQEGLKWDIFLQESSSISRLPIDDAAVCPVCRCCYAELGHILLLLILLCTSIDFSKLFLIYNGVSERGISPLESRLTKAFSVQLSFSVCFIQSVRDATHFLLTIRNSICLVLLSKV